MTEQPPAQPAQPSTAVVLVWIASILAIVVVVGGGLYLHHQHAQTDKYRKYARSDCQVEGFTKFDTGYDECVRKKIAGFKANGGVGPRY